MVGGGAGGLTAAAVAAEAGAQVVLVDERPTPGGQYYKQPAGARPGTMPSSPVAGGCSSARMRGVRFVAGAVWSASLPLRVEVYGEDGARDIPAATADRRDRRLRAPAAGAWLDAAGRDDHRCPANPDSQLRGPARPAVLITGNGPLNLQVACELGRAGAEIVAVAEAARRPAWALAILAAMAPRPRC